MTIVERERQTGLPQVVDPRVVKGAELLDDKMPGWADMVNVSTLDLAYGRCCVLGQIGLCVNMRDYERTARHLLGGGAGDGSDADREHGFWAAEREGEPDSWDTADASHLEYEWRCAILARRQA